MKLITIGKISAMVVIVAAIMSVAACEKAVDEESDVVSSSSSSKTTKDGKLNVTFRVAEFRQIPYEAMKRNDTRSVVDITSYCSHLNFVVYKDGKKIDSRTQTKGNADFGETTMSLRAGDYQLLVLAHSSVGGSPTLTDPEKIQFTNQLGYSDTFYYYGNLSVDNDQLTHEIRLTRASARLCFIVTDDIPENITHFYFTFTGGSGVLNAVTGTGGNVNSKQEKKVKVEGLTSPITFNLYTFLHEEEGLLNVKVDALNSKGEVVVSRSFEKVPVSRNKITEYKGSFFEKNHTLNFTADTDWADTLRISF